MMATEKRALDPLIVIGLAVTVAMHVGVIGGLWWFNHHASHGPVLSQTFVEAQLVRFGKPRDLSFLPHKVGRVKRVVAPEQIKVARDINQKPVVRKDEKHPDKVDPLAKTHAELFKQLDNDEPEVPDTQTGSLTGSQAGNATEAKGDPYILALIDRIGSAWQVPTTIQNNSQLSADVCLTIASSGALTHFEFVRSSKNSQFDSSLEATLSSIKSLPPPPARFADAAASGRLCATFTTPE